MSGLTLAAPWGLALGAAAASGLVVLHAITVGRPRPAWLPTARFAPDRAPRAARRLARPTDRRVLALRVVATLLAGLALAHPIRRLDRQHVARVVLADLADGAARATVRDSARGLVRPGDALIPFAATPRSPLVLPFRAGAAADDAGARLGAIDSALAAAPATIGAVPASLSAALIAARRTAATVALAADSVELVIVSPFGRDVVDAATASVRGTWPGRARLVRAGAIAPGGHPAGAAPGMAVGTAVALRGGPPDDALTAALALAGVAQRDTAPVRVVRGTVSAADRSWAGTPGHVLVVWPAGAPAARAGTAAPQAIIANGRAAIGPFVRGTTDDAATSTATSAPATPPIPVRTVARWADGAPAAVERFADGGGCVRTVGVGVPQVGDAALRPSFVALLPALLGPCGAPRALSPLPPVDLARLAGTGPLLAAAPLRVAREPRAADRLGAACLLAAAALLLLELPLRRLARRAESDDAATGDDASPVRGPFPASAPTPAPTPAPTAPRVAA